MDRDTFHDHLDRYGAELASWPVASQADAAALLLRSPDASAALRTMREVEVFFGKSAAMDRGDFDVMAATASRHRQITGRTASTRRVVAGTGCGLAAALALFFGYSIGNIAPSSHYESPDRMMAAALDTSGMSDVD